MMTRPLPRTDAPAVVFQSVSKSFGTFKVLRDIDLTVGQGERIVICGPSGSGKSTALRCINGLERYDRGTIAVDGIRLASEADASRVRRDVGMVFQSFNLFPHLTVQENCELAPMRVLKLSRSQARERAHQNLRKVRIIDQAQKYPGQLSGGQQQRAAIARALCMSPRIMLFDEPTSALDPELVAEVLQTMLDLAEEGMTMICVTHEMAFARKVADRIVFMDAGEIVEVAPPAEFFERPSHDRARQFVRQIA